MFIPPVSVGVRSAEPTHLFKKRIPNHFWFAQPIDLFPVTHSHESLLRAATCVFCQQSDKAAWTAGGGCLWFICVSK